jgi:hypothetical protein
MDSPPTIRSFCGTLLSNWLARLSGPISVPLAIAAIWVPQAWQQWGLIATAYVCLAVTAAALWGQERAKVIALQGRLSPRIAVALTPTIDGANLVRTGGNQFAKYFQLVISPLDDGELDQCMAKVISIERLASGGATTAIWDEPLICTWSNLDYAHAVLIRAGEGHRANLFSIREGENSVKPEFPAQFIILDRMKNPGTFRIAVNVSAKATLSKTVRLLLDWGGTYENVSLKLEAD